MGDLRFGGAGQLRVHVWPVRGVSNADVGAVDILPHGHRRSCDMVSVWVTHQRSSSLVLERTFSFSLVTAVLANPVSRQHWLVLCIRAVQLTQRQAISSCSVKLRASQIRCKITTWQMMPVR